MTNSHNNTNQRYELQIYTGIPSEPDFKEIDALHEELKTVQTKLQRFRQRVERMSQELDKKFQTEVQLLIDLAAKVQELKAQRDLEGTPDPVLDAITNAYKKAIREEHIRQGRQVPTDENELPVLPQQELRQLKKIYLWIAMRTHPDRTDRAELHEQFKLAQRAYVGRNRGALERVEAEVKYLIRDPEAVQLRAKLVAAMLSDQRAEFQRLVMSELGMELRMYEDPDTREISEQKYREKTLKAIQGLQTQIERLTRPRTEAPSRFMFINTSSTVYSTWR